MIDLHLHLDGSLTPNDLMTLAKLEGETLPTSDPEKLFSLMTFDGRGTLNDYLKKFDLPLSVMQSAESVEYAVRALGERLFSLGYEGAEIRFAPLLHTRKGASIREIVQGAVKGLQGCKLPLKLLLCCMRGADKKQMQRMVQLTLKLKEVLNPDDVADAAAIALCHLKSAPLQAQIKVQQNFLARLALEKQKQIKTKK